MLIGVGMLCYRAEVVVYPERGKVESYRGFLFPVLKESVPFGQLEMVRHRLVKRIRRSKNGTRTTFHFCTSLQGNDSLAIHESQDPLAGRRAAEELSRLTGLPLHDDSTGSLIVRGPGQLDEPLIARLKREQRESEPVEPPTGSRLRFERSGLGLNFELPTPDMAAMVGRALTVAGLMSLMTLLGVGQKAALVVLLLCPTLLLALVMLTPREQALKADAAGLGLVMASPLGRRTTTIPWSELEELHHGGGGVFAISDQTRLKFGAGLMDADRDWMVGQLHAHAATLELEVEQGSGAPAPGLDTGPGQDDRLMRLGRLCLPTAMLAFPIFIVQYQDFNRLLLEHLNRGYRLLGQSDSAPLQSLLLFLSCAMLSFYLLRGRGELPPFGALACTVPFGLLGFYSLAVWLSGASYSATMKLQAALVVATTILFAWEGLGVVLARRSRLRLRGLAAVAGFVWVFNAANAWLYDGDYDLPYGHARDFIAWVSPSFMLFWGFTGWQVWCGLAALAGLWLALYPSPRAARALSLLLVASLPLLASNLAPMAYAPLQPSYPIPPAPVAVIVANSLACVLPLILFYHWLGQELED
ncbi:MAG: hypothetical protein KC910_29170 [Candidatus Eremiobacteraeota bacterium]|nr:hypothetical protein [Candidatus Eremiobacteraeota bacterium]